MGSIVVPFWDYLRILNMKPKKELVWSPWVTNPYKAQEAL